MLTHQCFVLRGPATKHNGGHLSLANSFESAIKTIAADWKKMLKAAAAGSRRGCSKRRRRARRRSVMASAGYKAVWSGVCAEIGFDRVNILGFGCGDAAVLKIVCPKVVVLQQMSFVFV